MAAKVKDISDAQKQGLAESTSCCICTEIYKCPKLLPCGHTFCLNCIQETGLKTSKRPGDKMPCLVCRQQFKIPSDGFTGLKNNYYAEGLIRVTQILKPSDALFTVCDACSDENQDEAGKEVPKAEMYCWDCKQKLCEGCCRHHRKLKLTKNHKLISINELQSTDEDSLQRLGSIVCEFHKEEDLKIYCCVCKTVACSICFTENHEGHKGTHITKAVDDFRKEFANNIERVKTLISQAGMKKSEITNANEDVQKKLGAIQLDIINRREALKKDVDKHAKELLDKLSKICKTTMKKVKIETDNIDEQLARLESYNSYCNKIMTKGSAFDICRSSGDLSARLIGLQEENQPILEHTPAPFTLCFIKIRFKTEAGDNLIGQLIDRVKVEDVIRNDRIEIDKYSTDRDRDDKLEHKEDGELHLASNAERSGDVNLRTVKQKKFKFIRSKTSDKKKKVEMPNRVSFLNAHKFISMFSGIQIKAPTFEIVVDNSESMALRAFDSVTVEVNRKTITAIPDVDAVVSCINHQLDIDGPLADQIIKAAGPSVEKELVSHKNQRVFLQTGDLVHTRAGNLNGFKAIIHVVGPQEKGIFPINDETSRNDLRNVFTNCLCYANDELKLRSICLPPIGLGLYEAEMVLDCFINAVEKFASTVAATRQQRDHLKYIQLVSNDVRCIGQLINCVKKRLSEQ